ncbi:MAG: hypothetical protein FJ161_03440 [Gammaproteobacteria bacterium]|nr:hypothetical protein [Gammaproteobacteria bacterium]
MDKKIQDGLEVASTAKEQQKKEIIQNRLNFACTAKEQQEKEISEIQNFLLLSRPNELATYLIAAKNHDNDKKIEDLKLFLNQYIEEKLKNMELEDSGLLGQSISIISSKINEMNKVVPDLIIGGYSTIEAIEKKISEMEAEALKLSRVKSELNKIKSFITQTNVSDAGANKKLNKEFSEQERVCFNDLLQDKDFSTFYNNLEKVPAFLKQTVLNIYRCHSELNRSDKVKEFRRIYMLGRELCKEASNLNDSAYSIEKNNRESLFNMYKNLNSPIKNKSELDQALTKAEDVLNNWNSSKKKPYSNTYYLNILKKIYELLPNYPTVYVSNKYENSVMAFEYYQNNIQTAIKQSIEWISFPSLPNVELTETELNEIINRILQPESLSQLLGLLQNSSNVQASFDQYITGCIRITTCVKNDDDDAVSITSEMLELEEREPDYFVVDEDDTHPVLASQEAEVLIDLLKKFHVEESPDSEVSEEDMKAQNDIENFMNTHGLAWKFYYLKCLCIFNEALNSSKAPEAPETSGPNASNPIRSAYENLKSAYDDYYEYLSPNTTADMIVKPSKSNFDAICRAYNDLNSSQSSDEVKDSRVKTKSLMDKLRLLVKNELHTQCNDMVNELSFIKHQCQKSIETIAQEIDQTCQGAKGRVERLNALCDAGARYAHICRVSNPNFGPSGKKEKGGQKIQILSTIAQQIQKSQDLLSPKEKAEYAQILAREMTRLLTQYLYANFHEKTLDENPLYVYGNQFDIHNTITELSEIFEQDFYTREDTYQDKNAREIVSSMCEQYGVKIAKDIKVLQNFFTADSALKSVFKKELYDHFQTARSYVNKKGQQPGRALESKDFNKVYQDAFEEELQKMCDQHWKNRYINPEKIDRDMQVKVQELLEKYQPIKDWSQNLNEKRFSKPISFPNFYVDCKGEIETDYTKATSRQAFVIFLRNALTTLTYLMHAIGDLFSVESSQKYIREYDSGTQVKVVQKLLFNDTARVRAKDESEVPLPEKGAEMKRRKSI